MPDPALEILEFGQLDVPRNQLPQILRNGSDFDWRCAALFLEQDNGIAVVILPPSLLDAFDQAFDLGFVLVLLEIPLERRTGIGKEHLSHKTHVTGGPFDIKKDVRNGHGLFGQYCLEKQLPPALFE